MPENEPGHILYPLRPSELARHPEVVSGTAETLPLTEEDWEQLTAWEEPWADRLEQLINEQKLPIHVHAFSPEVFTGAAGSQQYRFFYEQDTLYQVVQQYCAEYAVAEGENDEEERKQLYAAAIKDAGAWEWPVAAGTVVQLPTLTTELQRRRSEQSIQPISLPFPSIDESEELSVETLNNQFTQLDLRTVPHEYLYALGAETGRRREEEFVREFREADGDLTAVSDPLRVRRVVNTDDLMRKLSGLRDLRRDVRSQEKAETGSDALSEARRIILSLYRERTNTFLADLYADAALLHNDHSGQQLAGSAETAVEAIPTLTDKNRRRINRFLQGIGIDEVSGEYQDITDRIAAQAERPTTGQEINETSRHYNDYKITAGQAKQLMQLLLDHYGALKGENPWTTIIDVGKRSLSVDNDSRIAQIPQRYNGGLVNAITVIEHEGAHALQRLNQDRATRHRLQIISRFPTGRNSVLAEAGAMQIGRQAKLEMVGVESNAAPYFYDGLRVKEAGGTFKECFAAMLASYAQRAKGLSVAELLHDDVAYSEAASYVYARALRLFREEDGLDNPTAGISSTMQLSYIEQEILTDVMEEHGIGSLVYLRGVDLYSLARLRRLGVIEMDEIQTPDLFLVHEFWPKIKIRLDSGQPFAEAWEETMKECTNA